MHTILHNLKISKIPVESSFSISVVLKTTGKTKFRNTSLILSCITTIPRTYLAYRFQKPSVRQIKERIPMRIVKKRAAKKKEMRAFDKVKNLEDPRACSAYGKKLPRACRRIRYIKTVWLRHGNAFFTAGV